jgi:hypothetical protein
VNSLLKSIKLKRRNGINPEIFKFEIVKEILVLYMKSENRADLNLNKIVNRVIQGLRLCRKES